MVWYSHLFQNFPQFIVIHTVKGFGIVNKAEIDVFLELSCFFHDPADVGNLISVSSAAAAKLLQSCPTLRPHRRQPTRLPRPWDSLGKNTGVGCHFLLQCMKVKSEVTQSCLTLSDPMDSAYQSPPSKGFSRREYWSGLPLPSESVCPSASSAFSKISLNIQV